MRNKKMRGCDEGARKREAKDDMKLLMQCAQALGVLDAVGMSIEVALELVPPDEIIEGELIHLAGEVERIQGLIMKLVGIEPPEDDEEGGEA